jgi:hypothetical protein
VTERLEILGKHLIGSPEIADRKKERQCSGHLFLNALYFSSWHNQECLKKIENKNLV